MLLGAGPVGGRQRRLCRLASKAVTCARQQGTADVRRIISLAMGLACISAAPAAAQDYRQENAGRAGNAAVIRIFEGGSFNRCAAHIGGDGNMLRIAFTKERVYTLSVPSTPTARAPHVLTLLLNPGGRRGLPGATGGTRAWATVDLQTIEAMMGARGPIVVEYGRNRYSWDLGAPVATVLQAVETCTNRAVGWR